MQRRSCLIALGSIALGGLTGCQSSDRSTLRLVALKGSLPSQLVGEFGKSLSPAPQVELAIEAQLADIFEHLQQWYKTGSAEAKGLKVPPIPPAKSPAYIPNLVSIGDAWLAAAISQKSIQPLDPSQIPSWQKLDPRWRTVAQRDGSGAPAATGQIWGVPYSWGTTVIIYRRDKLAAAQIPVPQDWEDLWHPQLQQRISLLDRSREVIGLTLKKLGYSYNHPDLNQVSNLSAELAKLDRQVKFYSADNYLQPLIMGDTWVAVGWSADVVDLLKKNNNLGAVVPRSGTALFTNLWVRPTTKTPPTASTIETAQKWLDYCLQPKASNQISLLTNSTAPLLTSLDRAQILPDILQDPLALPASAILAKSEFIYPLASQSQVQYDLLWRELRHQK